LFGLFPFLEKFFADAGYQGLRFRKQLAQLLPRLLVEIVKQSDSAKGFEVLPRPLPGSIDYRRLAKNFENPSRNAR
jgi:hypothetical protein